MSNTRRSESNEFNQEKYMSSTALERGLMANVIARRCQTLELPEEIELVWFIQYHSHQPGGLEKFCQEFLKAFPDRVGTEEMMSLTGLTQFSADQVRQVRGNRFFNQYDFPLKGEEPFDLSIILGEQEPEWDYPHESSNQFQDRKARFNQKKREAAASKKAESEAYPASYPVEAFRSICEKAFLETVPALLAEYCINPAQPISYLEIPFFNQFHSSLLEYLNLWEEKVLSNFVTTNISEPIFDCLKFSENERALVLIQGQPGIGKTYSIKTWCQARPGLRRYFQTPSSNDDIGFFRAIAQAVGISSAQSLKATQIRDRANQVLQTGHLSLIIDEAHYLFPQATTRNALPGRINWIMTALTNYSVSVALVATPQFTKAQAVVEKNSHWNSSQLVGRISRYEALPDELSKKSLRAVARFHLGKDDEECIGGLVAYACTSMRGMRGIESALKAARHQVGKGEEITPNDIAKAINKSVMPSDKALKDAMNPLTAATKKSRGRIHAAPLQPTGKPFLMTPQEGDSGEELSKPDMREKSHARISEESLSLESIV